MSAIGGVRFIQMLSGLTGEVCLETPAQNRAGKQADAPKGHQAMGISPTLIRSRRWSVTFDEADARDGAATVRERTQSFGSAKPRDRMQRKLLGAARRWFPFRFGATAGFSRRFITERSPGIPEPLRFRLRRVESKSK